MHSLKNKLLTDSTAVSASGNLILDQWTSITVRSLELIIYVILRLLVLHDYEAQSAPATIIHPKPYRGSPLRTDLGMVVASLAIEALSICSGKSLRSSVRFEEFQE